MKNIKGVAFDCDGVMFDTRTANRAYYNKVLGHFGKPPMTEEQFAYVHMHTVDESISQLFGNKESYEAAQAYRRRMSYLPFLEYMEIEPYLESLLEKLRPNFKTAIATNRSDTMMPLLVAHDLERFFDLVVRSLDVKRPKPFPDSLNMILDHFKVLPQEMIYVGDSELDESAAAAAGIPFVAYRNSSLRAKFHIMSLNEINTILDGCDK